MVGWTFTVAAPVTVTGLGWYAENPGGLSVSHEVGIWQYRLGSTNIDWGITNPPLLVSVVVGAGTNATLNGAYREVDLANPIILPVGYYVIGGTYSSEKVDPVKYIGGGGCFPTRGSWWWNLLFRSTILIPHFKCPMRCWWTPLGGEFG